MLHFLDAQFSFFDPDKSVARLFINAGTNTLFQCHVVPQQICELWDKFNEIDFYFLEIFACFLLFLRGLFTMGYDIFTRSLRRGVSASYLEIQHPRTCMTERDDWM